MFGLRPTNKRGERLRRDVRKVEQLLEIGLESPNAQTFVEQANEWCDVFAMSVHVGITPDDERPGLSDVYLGWLRAVQPFVAVGYLGKMVRDAGLSTDQGVALMHAGEWDPWADVAMPEPNPDPVSGEPAE